MVWKGDKVITLMVRNVEIIVVLAADFRSRGTSALMFYLGVNGPYADLGLERSLILKRVRWGLIE